MVQQKRIHLGTMRLWVWSLALLSGFRIQCFHELWCRLQTWLGSGVAMAVMKASSYSSNSTPSLGTSICRGCGPKKTKDKKKKKREREIEFTEVEKVVAKHAPLPPSGAPPLRQARKFLKRTSQRSWSFCRKPRSFSLAGHSWMNLSEASPVLLLKGSAAKFLGEMNTNS